MVGSMLPMQGAWVPSLARELRSHMLHGEAKEEQSLLKCKHTLAGRRKRDEAREVGKSRSNKLRISVLLLTSCVTLNKWSNPSVP